MAQDFPPLYDEATRERVVIVEPIQVSRSFENQIPGIHLLIEGTSYFIPKDEARRVARRILFKES